MAGSGATDSACFQKRSISLASSSQPSGRHARGLSGQDASRWPRNAHASSPEPQCGCDGRRYSRNSSALSKWTASTMFEVMLTVVRPIRIESVEHRDHLQAGAGRGSARLSGASRCYPAGLITTHVCSRTPKSAVHPDLRRAAPTSDIATGTLTAFASSISGATRRNSPTAIAASLQ